MCATCGASLSEDTSISAYVQASVWNRRLTGALIAGQLLGGRYRIVQLMGKGGFGAVYKASDERFQAQRVVAIKEMSDARLSPDEREHALKDFRQEANLLVQLNHPNLPTVSDFFEEAGKAYLVMEFVEGKALERVQEEAKEPLDEARVMGWAVQLCGVLHYLHTRPLPIIFRDLKPSNVMVTTDNQVKLIDFGIARVFKPTARKDTTLLGSQGYAPLEQYGRGQSDPRSDIYALGATLYDLLTNSVPADAPSRRVQPQVFVTPRQRNPHLSLATEAIILRAMEQDPKDRFQTAEEMQKAILAGSRAAANAPHSPSRTFPATTASTPIMQWQAPPADASPHGTFTSARTTFEREILPVVLDIGLSIAQAIKEQSARTEVNRNKAGVIRHPPTFTNPHVVEPAQGRFASAPSSLPPSPGVPLHESWASTLSRGISELLTAIMTMIYHLLGLASAIISLILMARFFLTFFHLTLGVFSSWVNALSAPLVTPFGMLLVLYHASSTTAYTIDVSTVIAFFVFAIGFGLLRELFKPFRDKLKRSGMHA